MGSVSRKNSGLALPSTAQDVQALAPDQELWAQLVAGTEAACLAPHSPSRKDKADLLEGGFHIGPWSRKGLTVAFLRACVPRASPRERPVCQVGTKRRSEGRGRGAASLIGNGQEVDQVAVWHLLREQERLGLSCVAKAFAPMTMLRSHTRPLPGSVRAALPPLGPSA